MSFLFLFLLFTLFCFVFQSVRNAFEIKTYKSGNIIYVILSSIFFITLLAARLPARPTSLAPSLPLLLLAVLISITKFFSVDHETGSRNIGSKQRFICSKRCYFAPKYILYDVKAIYSFRFTFKSLIQFLETTHDR